MSIDVCTPAVLSGGEWSYVDLEPDLYKTCDVVGIDDEDEFDVAVRAGLISDEEREACLATTDELVQRLIAGDRLLDKVAWSRLSEAIALGLAPITHLS